MEKTEEMVINGDMKEKREEIEIFGDYKKFYEKFMDYIDRGGRGIQAELSRSTGISEKHISDARRKYRRLSPKAQEQVLSFFGEAIESGAGTPMMSQNEKLLKEALDTERQTVYRLERDKSELFGKYIALKQEVADLTLAKMELESGIKQLQLENQKLRESLQDGNKRQGRDTA